MFNILLIIFIIITIVIFILMFGLLFFVSGISKVVNFILLLIFRNREDCPFCHGKKSMRIIKRDDGYIKLCDRCKFSVEVNEDNSENK